MYNNYSNYDLHNNTMYQDDERFFLAPFLFGGLAGTALGYGIANNNQINNQPMYPVYPMYYPMYTYTTYPTYSTSNNYYY